MKLHPENGKTDSRRRLRRLPALFCALLLLSGCGAAGEPSPTAEPEAPQAEQPAAAAQPAALRPNEPVIYVPQASGTAFVGAPPLVVDVSNAGEGYVMARYNGSAAKANLQLTGPDGITYKYFLPPSEEFKALPLTGGSGAYAVDGYENVQDSQYMVLFKESFQADLTDELLPFLYPNVYVDFNGESETVAKAQEIVAPATDDLEAVSLVYHYVVENVSYDTHKAETVTSGYLPVVDETLRSGTGICFDYAALTAAMLRSQNIPTKLEIGYAGSIYHAWISVYTQETGWIDRMIEFSGNAWTRMDPTFASGNNSSDAILKYIGDGSNYALQYSH